MLSTCRIVGYLLLAVFQFFTSLCGKTCINLHQNFTQETCAKCLYTSLECVSQEFFSEITRCTDKADRIDLVSLYQVLAVPGMGQSVKCPGSQKP